MNHMMEIRLKSGTNPMAIRLPLGLRAQVERTAELEHRSLSGQLVALVARGLRSRETTSAVSANKTSHAEPPPPRSQAHHDSPEG